MDNLWAKPTDDDDLPEGQELLVDIQSDGDDQPKYDAVNNVLEIPTADGGVTVQFGPERKRDDDSFDENLAEDLSEAELNLIANDLITGIEADDESRGEWLSTRERGIDLLGLKIEDTNGDIGGSSAPLEGMARTRHPVLLEAVLRSQATACGALLPAAGPAKAEVIGEATEELDQLAEVMEADFNDYLTNRAPEYYPDTRRTLFWSSFGGSGFKKVFNCPLRRRPVSESVDAKDIILSAGATDLTNATRVTHRIIMRPSMLRRMQLAGVYRDVKLGQPTQQSHNEVDEKQASVDGIALQVARPEDQPYTIFECACELDLDAFAPKQFKNKGLQLPYRVTLDKDSRKILEIRRNWEDDDPQCLRRKSLVKYPFIEAMGVYGLGLLHMLGNATTALTAAWRIQLDNGMFANFPGGIVDKAASRQLTNEFRIPPGGMVQLDFGGRPASQVFGSLPYRGLDATFTGFVNSVQETTERLGGTADTQVGEGKQDAPVGTTIALLEQQGKVMSEVHKGLCTAQAEELQLLRECFRRDPSAMWRHNPRSKTIKFMMDSKGLKPFEDDEKAAEKRREDLFLAALNAVEIVPVADPNTPTHMHRLMRVQGLMQLAQAMPNIDQDEVGRIAVRELGFDPMALVKPPQPGEAPPNPELIAAQAALVGAQAKMADAQQKAQGAGREMELKQAQMQADLQGKQLDLQREQIIHQGDIQQTALKARADQAQQTQKLHTDFVNQHLNRQADVAKHAASTAADVYKFRNQVASDHLKQRNQVASDHIQQMRDHAHERGLAGHTAAIDQVQQLRDHAHQQRLQALKPVPQPGKKTNGGKA